MAEKEEEGGDRMAKSKNITANIIIDGKTDPAIAKAIKDLAGNMDEIEAAAKAAAGASGELAAVIKNQEKTLKNAQLAYQNYALAGEEGSDAAQKLADEISALSSDLERNKADLKAAQDAARSLADGYDEAAGGVDDMNDAADNSKGGFSSMKVAIGNLISGGISLLVSKCVEAVGAIWGLAESTREFRQDMGTLETAFSQAGFSAAQAEDTWKDLYGVFGEDDRAVEAANNIARMADSQKELDQWTKITTGIWGTYQDALPVESLAEAAGETAKTGTVTGTLADALNWSSEAAEMFADYMGGDVVTAEDAFNKALSECSNEQERQQLITETLTALYGDAAETYEETAGSIIDANKANADWNMTMAEMGEAIEPVTTAVKSGMTGMIQELMRAFKGVNIESVISGIGTAFERLGQWLAPVAEALVDLAINVAPLLGAAFEAISPIVGVVFGLFGQAVGFISEVAGAITNLLTPVIQALEPVLQWFAEVANLSFIAIFDYMSGVVQNLKGVLDGLISFIQNVFAGNWQAAWENVKSIFANAFGALAGLVAAPINAVISIVNRAIDGLNSLSVDIPDWVPLVGGKHFGLNIPHIPMLAKGGFTEGITIAGEAGTEAVISFDPRYREQNLGYWAKAGEILGATGSDMSFSLAGSGGGGQYIDFGGVTFAPNIHIEGEADEDSIVKAIEKEYPEFMDLLERWVKERSVTAYA